MAVPAVSVIIPTYNRAALLAEAVTSVRAQTFTDWELIVVDDGSTDETLEVLAAVKEPRLTVLTLPHTGNPSRVRNAGLARATGRYVAFLDSDDLWEREKLEVQLRALEQSGCRWSYTGFRYIDFDGRALHRKESWVPHDGFILERLIRFDAIIKLPTVLVERVVLESVGRFDETCAICEDYELWMRLSENHPVHVERRVLTAVRIHAVHIGADLAAAHAGWVYLFDRRARTATNPALRDLCALRSAHHSVKLARAIAVRGSAADAWARLRVAAPLTRKTRAYWVAFALVMLAHFPAARRLVRLLFGRPP